MGLSTSVRCAAVFGFAEDSHTSKETLQTRPEDPALLSFPLSSATVGIVGGNAEPEVTQNLESTATLLSRVRDGDSAARDRLCAIYLPMLTRWAHGRLPLYARDLAETDDLVQVTLLRALNNVERFKPEREGAFLAYLRRITLNGIREEIRKTVSKPGRSKLPEGLPDPAQSVVEKAIGSQAMEDYEEALASLPEEQREVVILRLEFGFTYPEIAAAMNRPSANAARMMVSRALVKLVEAMP